MNQDNDVTYKYYTKRRPPDIGTIPKDFVNIKSYGERKTVMANGMQAWGEVVYNRKLTEKEINDYELLEDITEDKKKEVLQDIQNLDKIYKQITKTDFKNSKLISLMNKITDLIKKEVANKIRQNNVSNKEYEKITNENYVVNMNKDEMIRFYADKIIYDCITDCSENNRIFYVDEYKDNDFIIKNFAEIVNRINLDERVSDLEVDSDKKEIDMIFYLEYCPHYYIEDLDISNESRITYLKNFKNYICDCKICTPERWLRTNTRELINNFYTSECYYEEDKDLVYNVLSEELNRCGFIDKYLDGYTVNVNIDNIEDLINCLDERIKELQLSIESREVENG